MLRALMDRVAGKLCSVICTHFRATGGGLFARVDAFRFVVVDGARVLLRYSPPMVLESTEGDHVLSLAAVCCPSSRRSARAAAAGRATQRPDLGDMAAGPCPYTCRRPHCAQGTRRSISKYMDGPARSSAPRAANRRGVRSVHSTY